MGRITTITAFVFVSLVCSNSFANTVKVTTKKGNKAVIEGPDVSKLLIGEEYEIGSDLSTSAHSASSGLVGKSYSISGITSTSFFSGKQEATSSSADYSIFSVVTQLGFLLKQFEIGPIASYTNTSGGSTTSSKFGLGAFADYNFSGGQKSFIFGPSAKIQLISGSTGSTSYSGSEIDIAAFAKWFPINAPFCVRAELFYQIGKDNLSKSVSLSGFGAGAGASFYF